MQGLAGGKYNVAAMIRELYMPPLPDGCFGMSYTITYALFNISPGFCSRPKTPCMQKTKAKHSKKCSAFMPLCAYLCIIYTNA